jgi:rare lipoprotein A
MSSALVTGLVMASIYYPHDSGFARTPTGQRNHPEALTCAHKTLPFGTRLILHNGSRYSVEIVINDRGPFVGGRHLDCMPAVAKALHFSGLGRLRVEFFPPLPQQRPTGVK